MKAQNLECDSTDIRRAEQRGEFSVMEKFWAKAKGKRSVQS